VAACLLLICFISCSTCSIGRGAETAEADEGVLAQRILADTGVRGGLIVHVGCGDGKLTAALRFGERYVVHGLDVDEANVARARSQIDSLDLYGPVSAVQFDGRHLPYADRLVNLVVSEDLGSVSMEEVLRVLAPGGVAYIQKGGSWERVDNPWPEEIDEWTHWLHDASGNPVARDTVVGPPREMQWFAKPLWSRSHEKSPSLTGMVSAKGRLFYISDEAPASVGGPLPDKWRLVARDAFSGVVLWKRPVTDWGWKAWSPSQPMNLRWGNPRFIHRRLVAVDDRVYVTLGYGAAVTALDAATGETIRVYEGTENTSEILYHEGLLVLSAATEPKTAIKSAPPLRILAIRATSGKRVWEAGPFPSLYDLGERGKSNVLKQGRLMIAAGGDHVYCVTDKEIRALGLDDGEPAWSVPRPVAVLPKGESKKVRVAASKMFTNLGSVMVHDGRVFYAQPHVPTNKLVNNVPMTLVCLSAATGEERWRKICGDWSYTTNLNVYAARGLIWVHADRREGPYDLVGLVPETGDVEVKYDLASVLSTRHHHRCYRNKATENFLLMGKEGVEYVDLATGAVLPHRWLRGMCLYGIMPANGLLYVPPQACSCNPMTMLQGYWALAAKRGEGRAVREVGQVGSSAAPRTPRRSTADSTLRKIGPCTGTIGCEAEPAVLAWRRNCVNVGRRPSAAGSPGPSWGAAAFIWAAVIRMSSSPSTRTTAPWSGASARVATWTVRRRSIKGWSWPAARTVTSTACGPRTAGSFGGSAARRASATSLPRIAWSRPGRCTGA